MNLGICEAFREEALKEREAGAFEAIQEERRCALARLALHSGNCVQAERPAPAVAVILLGRTSRGPAKLIAIKSTRKEL